DYYCYSGDDKNGFF
nr:immunoglobulin light chain junction region [Macaca mulatta]MOW16788.1 immunoglobulin light chain junction region [Macaca mulatta]